jgi:glycosyltransferase involved in cell wall biosynthesis
LPREWLYALDRVDELWAGSTFVAEAMRRSTAKPVVKIPPAIELALSRLWRRSDFGLPEDRFLFLFTFDFNSVVKRKNPQGTVTAFKRAFGARRDVGLVIKSTNGALQPERLRALESLIDGDERVTVKDEFLNRDALLGLQSVVDAFVSLHRAEGFGLGLAESMYLGKPVIGTAYSGNLEFMSESNSCLVDFELVPLSEGDYVYADSRGRWAEPDVEHAAYQMRRLVDDAAFRDRIAAAARHDMRSRFSRAATASLIRSRLAELGLI